jgi:glyoxylase-like metal-dependent hydrolase (beta-lactamase superfamily II)
MSAASVHDGASDHAWSTSGVEDLGAGVYRIPLPLRDDALLAVNVYAILGENGLDLIDAGQVMVGARAELTGALRSVGCELGDVRNIYVTHYHRDHYTLAVDIRRHESTVIRLGAGERPNLDAIRQLVNGSDEFGVLADLRRTGALELAQTLDVTRRPGQGEWEDPDHWLEDGTEVQAGSRTLRAIHTPGHTRGHLVYHDATNNVLFAGDHILPAITPTIGFEPATNMTALRDYMASLRLVRALPNTRLLPAHGPVRDTTHYRIDELLEHHEVRLGHTYQAVLDGERTAFQVAAVLRWTRRERRFDELTPFNQYFACTETSAHLELLRERGDVRRLVAPDGALHYEPVY